MYFWDGKQVILEPKEILITDCDAYLNMYCCDDASSDVTFGRYGMFTDRPRNGPYWRGGPVTAFPKEFRAHLLLLGVS